MPLDTDAFGQCQLDPQLSLPAESGQSSTPPSIGSDTTFSGLLDRPVPPWPRLRRGHEFKGTPELQRRRQDRVQARVRLRVVEEKSVLRGPSGERFRTASLRSLAREGCPLRSPKGEAGRSIRELQLAIRQRVISEIAQTI